MSSADEKNRQALKALFGSDVLADRLTAVRIGVIFSPEVASAALLGDYLADVLARLWPNIEFSGVFADRTAKVAHAAARAGGATGDGIRIAWAPPYDVVVAVGFDCPAQANHLLRIGANGWNAALGAGATCGDDSNPVGPAYAAALAGAQVFRRIFAPELANMGAPPMEDWAGDVRDLSGATGLAVGPISLSDTHFFGVGAVTHGLVSVLEKWPGGVEGEVDLVDQDRYGPSNAQRYAGMQSENIEEFKVEVVKGRLQTAHPRLRVRPHPVDANTYCAARGYDPVPSRAVVGLDSAEARRQVAFKLPHRTINMWTGGERAGASRYVPVGQCACLACSYLEDTGTPLDEVAHLHRQTGLRPDKIRSLLGGRPLTEGEAEEIAKRWNTDWRLLVGQPLRSALPILCATGKLQLGPQAEAADVPFAFASLFAGVAGFMMLIKDLNLPEGSEGVTAHLFKPATPHLLQPLYRRETCPRCEAADALAAML